MRSGARNLLEFKAPCIVDASPPVVVERVPAVRQVHVSISDADCGPQVLTIPAGPATFSVTNTGTASVLEYEIEQSGRIIGEVENVIPGIDRSFTLNLKPGAYIRYCPGGTLAATGTLNVTE
jgi:iron uptake system EfeUOB component EfeO/EfeM